MRTLLLATQNSGKVLEIRSILSEVPLEIKSLLDYPNCPTVEEDAPTLEANALKKAREIHQWSGLPTLADDSGLEVYALEMRPGVRSARFAGEKVTYAENNRKLLQELSHLPPDRRRARFRCVAALVTENIEKIIEGVCEGSITDEPRGAGGFGYDPLFVPAGFEATFAELNSDVKNRISHRARAFLPMRDFLLTHLQSP